MNNSQLAISAAAMGDAEITVESITQILNQRIQNQLFREDTLGSFFERDYTSSNEGSSTVILRHPNESSIQTTLQPFFTARPVFFHTAIRVLPIENNVGRFTVFSQPRAPDGNLCTLELGQIVVIHPNYTIAWYLEGFDYDNDNITYTAQNDQAGVVRYFTIKP